MTPCDIPPAVEEYLQLVESKAFCFCEEQEALAALIRKSFAKDDIFVDTKQLEDYLSLQKYFPFALFPWEKFILALWDCTYWRSNNLPRWKTAFAMVGRGAGKDAFIAYDSFCSVSPYNPVPAYDVDICANNEEQATRPVSDLVDVLEQPEHKPKLARFFYHTKETVRGRTNKGYMRGRTNNPKGRDGMRSGKIILNEVHQYENYANINVFTTGLGKKAQPRKGFFTSNGNVVGGPLDDYLTRGRQILFDGAPDKGFLPFICCLNKPEQVHDKANWTMSNPSLPYLPNLETEIAEEYDDWVERPEQNGEFMSKRMGLRMGNLGELTVTEYEKIQATNKPMPELTGKSCTIGIDYATLNDWAAVDLHFKLGDARYDINHAWVCLRSKYLHRLQVPLKEWATAGHITLIDDVEISAEYIAAYIAEASKRYDVRGVALDNYRYALVAEALRKIGVDATERKNLKLVRPADIMKTEPVIQHCFDCGCFAWGDQPQLRWAVNNTKRKPASRQIGSDTGNYYYAKIQPESRKTDPFMALVAAMTIEDLLDNCQPDDLPEVPIFSW